jgi:hypothetical protein
MQRSLKPQSTGQHRGDPPFLPAWLSSDSSSFVNCRANRPTRVRVSPLAPFHAPVAQFIRAGASNRQAAGEIPAGSTISPRWPNYQRRSAQDGEVGGGNPSRGTNLAHVVQCRDGALKTRTVSVQIRPWAPSFAPSFCSVSQPRVAQLAEASRSNREDCRCNSCHADHFWNANRTSEPGLGANECVPSGKWRKSTAFRHFMRA